MEVKQVSQNEYEVSNNGNVEYMYKIKENWAVNPNSFIALLKVVEHPYNCSCADTYKVNN